MCFPISVFRMGVRGAGTSRGNNTLGWGRLLLTVRCGSRTHRSWRRDPCAHGKSTESMRILTLDAIFSTLEALCVRCRTASMTEKFKCAPLQLEESGSQNVAQTPRSIHSLSHFFNICLRTRDCHSDGESAYLERGAHCMPAHSRCDQSGHLGRPSCGIGFCNTN